MSNKDLEKIGDKAYQYALKNLTWESIINIIMKNIKI